MGGGYVGIEDPDIEECALEVLPTPPGVSGSIALTGNDNYKACSVVPGI